ncbi:MAG TPA: hypothetical protein VMW25_01630 [Clostridia bacterium]|nr:hypothetical protein [Clostridia bacterium]
MYGLAFFALAVFFLARFTPTNKAVFIHRVFIKFSSGLDFVALGTSFRYDLLSHNRLLIRRFWLEPFVGYAPQVARFILSSDSDLASFFLSQNQLCRDEY